MKAVWTKEKIYITALFFALIVLIIASLYFNRKGNNCSENESFNVMKRKILILYTGGKSSSKHQHGVFESELKDSTRRMKNVAPYDIIEYQKLVNSSNMKPKDWVHIGLDIAKRYDDYDAFIVIHGSDTMAYTASALSFMLENLDKPVILSVRQNVITSLLLASKYKIPEVVICCGKNIIRGNRGTKIDTNSINSFASPNFPLLGHIGSSVTLRDDLILNHPKDAFKFLHINPQVKVVVIKMFPGINSQYLASIVKGSKIHGIVLETFGAGKSVNKGFVNLVEYLIKQGIVVVNVSQCLYKDDDVTGKALQKAGVVPGQNMTTESALTKVSWLLSNLEKPNMDIVAKLVTMPMRGEL